MKLNFSNPFLGESYPRPPKSEDLPELEFQPKIGGSFPITTTVKRTGEERTHNYHAVGDIVEANGNIRIATVLRRDSTSEIHLKFAISGGEMDPDTERMLKAYLNKNPNLIG